MYTTTQKHVILTEYYNLYLLKYVTSDKWFETDEIKEESLLVQAYDYNPLAHKHTSHTTHFPLYK